VEPGGKSPDASFRELWHSGMDFGPQIVAIEHFDADDLSIDHIEKESARKSQGEVIWRIGRGSIWCRVERRTEAVTATAAVEDG
jgi:hypothetical protein